MKGLNFQIIALSALALCTAQDDTTTILDLPSRLIALEEHVLLPTLGLGNGVARQVLDNLPDTLMPRLRDLSSLRLATMDAGHVTKQVISHVPVGDLNVSAVRLANDQLAGAVTSHPDRFRAFAILPMAFPDAAAGELERCVRELAAVGALIDNNLSNGTTYDAEQFWPVFEAAERLDVPIYIHPAPPSPEAFESMYQGNYPTGVAISLATSAWGWHVNNALHILRLYAAGLFDRYPKLKIIIGHDGELLPMFLDRIDRILSPQHDRSFQNVWNSNIWITTSGVFSMKSFEMLLMATKRDRIMYSVDYPFVNATEGWQFIQNLTTNGLLSQHELNMFAYETAEKLLRL